MVSTVACSLCCMCPLLNCIVPPGLSSVTLLHKSMHTFMDEKVRWGETKACIIIEQFMTHYTKQQRGFQVCSIYVYTPRFIRASERLRSAIISDAVRTDEMLHVLSIKTFYMHVFSLQHIHHRLEKQRGALRSRGSVRHFSDGNTQACLRGRTRL